MILGGQSPASWHHAKHRRDADLDAATAQLVADLARSEPGVLVPLAEDFAIALRLDVARCRPARWRRPFALGCFVELTLPLVQRRAADIQLTRCSADASCCGGLQRLSFLRRHVAPCGLLACSRLRGAVRSISAATSNRARPGRCWPRPLPGAERMHGAAHHTHVAIRGRVGSAAATIAVLCKAS